MQSGSDTHEPAGLHYTLTANPPCCLQLCLGIAGNVSSANTCLHADHSSRDAALVLLQDAENNWAFDIFGFADATPGYSLSLLFCHLVRSSGLQSMVDEPKLVHYARRIERGYDAANPYHNRSSLLALVLTVS